MRKDTPIMLPSDSELLAAGLPPERIAVRRASGPGGGQHVLYWMQASQREHANPALEYALLAGHKLHLPVAVVFVLNSAFPAANMRHFHFMGEGLCDVATALAARRLPFVLREGAAADVIPGLARNAALLVMDRAYLRAPVAWREEVLRRTACPVVEVEGDVIVPVETASDHEEYAARTIRPKINRQRERFLIPVRKQKTPAGSCDEVFVPVSRETITTCIAALPVDRSIAPSTRFRGGQTVARDLLHRFLTHALARFDRRNDPTADAVSLLSPYLHFGQISPVDIACAVRDSGHANAEDFLEQLIVRRELAVNFTYYNEHYDRFACLPDWARATLEDHARDDRETIYTRAQLEAASTHDAAWNAAQRELTATGHMAGYMRMYWGKKALEWSPTPEMAFETLVYLNDRYELDGRDPNGYAGIAWCFGKHDRPWTPRAVFGTIRYMNAAGLARKFDVAAYIRHVDALAEGR